jgi:diguanylate cyclase (GGDEF)-like protein
MNSDTRTKILVIDDVPANIFVVFDAFRDEYEISFALSGEDGIRLAVEQQPALIMLDISMPGLDGYETCRRLHAGEQTRDIPVMFITAQSEEIDEVVGFACGAVDYLTKPLNVPVARARIRSHLDLKSTRDMLDEQARVDGLTGLPNRRSFDESMGREWRRAQRSRHPLAIAMIDVDMFKSYNDTYGHPAGDQCLRAIGRALDESLRRPGDVAARYGGEEFACIISDADLGTACALADRARNRVESLCIHHEGSPHGVVTISLGVASCVPGPDGDWHAVLRAADERLYAAKAEGRNSVIPAP